AGHHDVGVALENLLIAERHRAQPGAAQLIDAPSRRLYRDAGGDRGLACGILSLSGPQDLAHDDLGNAARLDTRALERRLDGRLSEVMGRQVAEGAVEASDWRACSADDDDVVLHLRNSSDIAGATSRKSFRLCARRCFRPTCPCAPKKTRYRCRAMLSI